MGWFVVDGYNGGATIVREPTVFEYIPDNVFIRTLFFIARFLRRIPFYPVNERFCTPEQREFIKDWDHQRYLIERERARRSTSLDEKFRGGHVGIYKTTRDWLQYPGYVVAYEIQHRVRWKRLSDLILYADSKYTGFNPDAFFSTRWEH